MFLFEHLRYYRQNPTGRFSSPSAHFSSARHGARQLVSIAILLIGLAVLMLLFPMILAVIVAGLCITAALFLLKLAWHIHRTYRHIVGPPCSPPINPVESDDDDDIYPIA